MQLATTTGAYFVLYAVPSMMRKGLKAVTSVTEAARKAGTTPLVELALDTGKADSLSVTLPVDGLKTLSSEQGSLAITSDAADVTLDAAALAAIGEQASGKVTLAVSAVDSDDLTEEQKAAAGDGVVYDLSHQRRQGDCRPEDRQGHRHSLLCAERGPGGRRRGGVLHGRRGRPDRLPDQL